MDEQVGYSTLICEPDAEFAAEIKKVLEGLGWSVVVSASSADEAVRLAQELQPDIVIVALTSGSEQDGIALTRRIMQTQPTVVAVLSETADNDVVDAALDAGGCAFFVKPFEVEKIVPGLFLARRRFLALQEAIEEANSIKATLQPAKKDDLFERMWRNTKPIPGGTATKPRKSSEFIH